jgi:ABC-type nitrate/sulfonate/bicarbonate transport system permease component
MDSRLVLQGFLAGNIAAILIAVTFVHSRAMERAFSQLLCSSTRSRSSHQQFWC